MNELLLTLGIESWKPFFAALLLPPVPLLLLVLFGARLILWRRGLGWFVLLLGVVLIWLASSVGAAEALKKATRAPSLLMTEERVAELRKAAAASAANKPTIAVVVLGGGREVLAPEYGVASLSEPALERLRYGVWLSKAIGAPLIYSGGTGHGSADGKPEADIAADIAARELGRPMLWAENQSRDTRENARYTAKKLGELGMRRVLLVTHDWHMKRALRAFSQESQAVGVALEVTAAPMGMGAKQDHSVLRWMPSGEGLLLMRQVLREWIAYAMGA